MRPIAASIITFLLFLNPGWGNSAEITICFTNDLHGGIDRTDAVYMNPDFPPPLGGGASMKAVVDIFRQNASGTGHGFLLIDDGDFFQGTPIGTKTQGRAIVDFMNRLGFDASTVGNHDFDLGKEVLMNLAKNSNFPLLACNLLDAKTGKVVDFVKPYIIKEVAGVKVALVGAILHSTPSMSFPEHIAGLVFAPEVPNLAKWMQIARNHGAQIVIAVVHTGLPYDREQGWKELQEKSKRGFDSDFADNAMELAHRVPGVDVFLCGHIHVGYAKPWEDPVTHAICFQTYGRGTGIGVVTLGINDTTHTLSGYRFPSDDGDLLTLFEEEFPRDDQEAVAIDTVVARVEAGMDTPIGSAAEPISRTGAYESGMGNLVADAMREELRGDFAFTNKGGVRSEFAIGPITPRDVFQVIPFENQLVVVNVSGEFLKKLIEEALQRRGSGLYISGGRLVVDPTAPEKQRIVSLEVGGEPSKPDKIYRVVTTDYLLQGNSGMQSLTTISEVNVNYTGVLMRSALQDYISKNSPIKPRLDGRWREVVKTGS